MKRRMRRFQGIFNPAQTGRRLSAGLHNLLLGVSRAARRLPRGWRYYSLPVLVVALGIITGYGQVIRLLPPQLGESLREAREGIGQPRERDLFSQNIINLVESEDAEPDSEPVVPSLTQVKPEPEDTPGDARSEDNDPEPAETDGGALTPVTEPAWPTLSTLQLRKPVAGKLTKGFGMAYSKTHLDWRFHPGVDFRTAAGATVRAALAGQVARVEKTVEYEYVITLDHGNGIVTVYANCAEAAVVAGQKVAAGDALGITGGRGLAELADGCHLHFVLLQDGEPVDPRQYLQ